MKNSAINRNGDVLLENNNKGSDIASQRLDDLDKACANEVLTLSRMGKVQVLELGCGRCGLANYLADLSVSAVVRAVDCDDYSAHASANVAFVQDDMFEYMGFQRAFSVDVAVSQRTIHYMSYTYASEFVNRVYRSLKLKGKFFLSCSGLHSELGSDPYPRDLPLEKRFAFLSPEMQKKHGIRMAVCLYSIEEITALMESAGFVVTSAKTSDFGNHKLVGEKL